MKRWHEVKVVLKGGDLSLRVAMHNQVVAQHNQGVAVLNHSVVMHNHGVALYNQSYDSCLSGFVHAYLL